MTSREPDLLRVAVASEQSLISESVRAALAGRGLGATALRWPGEQMTFSRRPDPRRSFDVGLLISDLDRWGRLRSTGLLLGGVQAPWIVLTGAERGPLWGAAVELGARAVLSSATSLDEVVASLESVGRGEAVMSLEEQDELRGSWVEMRHQRQLLKDRVQSLTPREREVLRLLYAGASVARIADQFEVSPATVRSQVKAVLRKLDVKSQLAAVAAFGYLVRMGQPELLTH